MKKPPESDIEKLKQARHTRDATLFQIDTEIFTRLAGLNRLLSLYYPIFEKSAENAAELEELGIELEQPEALAKLRVIDPAAPPPLSFKEILVKAADILTSPTGPWPTGHKLPDLLDEAAGEEAWEELGDNQAREMLHTMNPDDEVIQ